MKIIIPIISYKNTASVNRLLAYAKGFVKNGTTVIVLFLTSRDKQKCNINIPNVEIINLWESDNSICKKYVLLSYLKNFFKIKKYVQIGDYLFLHGFFLHQFIYVHYFLKDVKVVCEVSEHPFRSGISFYKKVHNNIYIKFIRNINSLFVISKSLKDYFISCGIDPNKIHIINMFVDSSRFRNLEKTTKEKYIGYCGSVSVQKDGVDLLLRSFALFNKKHIDYNLYIIGKCADKPLSYFEDLANELGISKNVIFTGEIERDKMPQLLYNAEILTLARPNNLQAQNGFPTKLGEYLATGNPIVVTSVGEIPFFIKNGVNGMLAEPSNVYDFAEKLDWLVTHREQAIKIGEQGKKLVNNEFSYIVQVRKFLDCIS